jgi:hypothetical protein
VLYDRAVPGRNLAALAFASAALLLAMQSKGLAQGAPMRVPSDARVDPAAERIRDEQRREMQLGRLEAGAGRTDERSVKAAAEQLNQDFKRIQVIRNDIAHALKVEGVLDYKRVSGQAAEVRKRALRMQTYLALRGKEGEGKESAGRDEYDEEGMKAALVNLCKRIDSFVANPRFTSPDVMNVDATSKAGRDLQEIISLSGAVRGSAEKMTQKNN